MQPLKSMVMSACLYVKSERMLENYMYSVHSFIHSFLSSLKHSLHICYMSDTDSGHGHIAMNKTDKNLYPHGVYILTRGDIQ